VREIITDGVNGRLFDFFDEKALAARVGETLSDTDTSAAMAREARRIALERYDYETVCLPQWRDFLGVR
jgi:glycosyltransferase involved in cell wall biosynthesis